MKLIHAGGRMFGLSLVGLDDDAWVPRALELAAAYPFVAWGLLVHSDGHVANKFASKRLLDAAAAQAPADGSAPFSLHLCGPAIGAMLDDAAMMDGLHACRPAAIQISIRDLQPGLAPALHKAMRRYPRTPFVVQDSAGLPRWWAPLIDEPNLGILVDDSLGRGLAPAQWRRGVGARGSVGYAGGLNAGNLRAELDRIAAVAGPAFWVDLQSGLRDADDRFSMALAEEVVGIACRWWAAQVSDAGAHAESSDAG